MQWYDTVQEIRARKLELACIDPRGGMPIIPPRGAAEKGIAAVEARLRRPLPPSYRAFLELHDGWQELYQGASLPSVRHLARGTYEDVTRLVLDEWDDTHGPRTLESSRSRGRAARRHAPRGQLVPFGIDAKAETIFAWNLRAPSGDGELEVVVWINEIGERIESFPRFLDLILELLTADVEERRRRVSESRLSLGSGQRLAIPA